MSVKRVLGEGRSIDILLALLDQNTHIRGLQRKIGGSLSTIKQRVDELLQAGLIREAGERVGYRDLELTNKGRSIALIIRSLETLSREDYDVAILPRGKQKWILILLHGLGRVKGTTRLEKLLFLLKEQFNVVSGSFYRFKPYFLGPYSPELPRDVVRLFKAELLDIEEDLLDAGELSDWIFFEKTYTLTKEGTEKAKDLYDDLSEKIKIREAIEGLQEYNSMPLNFLLSYTWRKFPEYVKAEASL
jgi:DNA-binding HxlR family transcriptional regulator/uncharacterized protein YwgA